MAITTTVSIVIQASTPAEWTNLLVPWIATVTPELAAMTPPGSITTQAGQRRTTLSYQVPFDPANG